MSITTIIILLGLVAWDHPTPREPRLGREIYDDWSMCEGDGTTIDFVMVEPLLNLIQQKGLIPLVPLYTYIFTHDLLIVIISQHASALMQMILGDLVLILD